MAERKKTRAEYLEWVLEVQSPDNGISGTAEFLLTLREKESGRAIEVIEARSDFDGFVAALGEIKSRLAEVETEARSRFDQVFSNHAATPVGPEELWRQLAASPSDQAMFESFNALFATSRAAVAEHVFSRVSMFSGKGPIFAEHYNAVSQILE